MRIPQNDLPQNDGIAFFGAFLEELLALLAQERLLAKAQTTFWGHLF